MTYGIYQHQSTTCPGSMTGEAGIFFLTLINTLFTNQCRLGNQKDYPPNFGTELNDNDVFDYIIIGAGTAGSVIAASLAKKTDSKILLLEAGGYPSPTSDIPAFHLSLQKTTEDWQFHSEKSDKSCLGFPNGKCPIPAGKVLGGSSTINSMIYLRGSKHTYNSWSQNGNLGWAYQDILPIFKKLEKFHENSTDGTIPLTKNSNHGQLRNAIFNSAQILGQKMSPRENQLGFFESPLTIHKGVRKNSARIFLKDFEILPNLKVVTEAFVEKIHIEKEVKEASGVRVNIAGNIFNIYAEKEVILSAGAINSPKLLMLSGIGPREHLGSLGIETMANLKVGDNLRDHFTFPLFGIKLNVNSTKYFHDPDQELFKYFTEHAGLLAGTGLGNLIGLLDTNRDSEADIKLTYTYVPYQDSYIISQYGKNFNLNVREEPLKSLGEANKNHHVLLVAITLLSPKSKGEIKLKSMNPHEKPMIYSNFLSDDSDLNAMISGIKFVENQTKSEPFRKLSAKMIDFNIPNCKNSKFNSEEYWKCAIRNFGTSGYNQIGTCKMGLSIDDSAVVDPLLRVHGVGKLRVVDSSIIPTSLRSDVAGATFMIGQKGADLILKGFDLYHK